MRHRIKEAIIVEGRYDKNAVSQIADTAIIETRGFAVFSDAKLTAFIRKIAEQRGIIILTDSDSAGFLIRNHIKSAIKSEYIKHAYIPGIDGRERRKKADSKEGKLGVEGMTPEIIERALRAGGATFLDEKADGSRTDAISFADMYEAGLSGGKNSAALRRRLLEQLDLPEYLSAAALADFLSTAYSREEFLALAAEVRARQ